MKTINPLLSYDFQINDCPTVDLDALKAIFAESCFDVVVKENNGEADFKVMGHDNTVAAGIEFKGTMIRSEDGLSFNGWSTVISHVSWDCYNVTQDGELADDDLVYDLTEQFFERLGLIKACEQYI